jgi:glucose dehydrogenase
LPGGTAENNEYLSPVNQCPGGDSKREPPEKKNLKHYCYSDLLCSRFVKKMDYEKIITLPSTNFTFVV